MNTLQIMIAAILLAVILSIHPAPPQAYDDQEDSADDGFCFALVLHEYDNGCDYYEFECANSLEVLEF